MEPNPILSAPDDALVCWCGKVEQNLIERGYSLY